MYLAIEIAAADPMHIPQIGLVHPNQEVKTVVILVLQLTSGVAVLRKSGAAVRSCWYLMNCLIVFHGPGLWCQNNSG